MQNAHKIYLCKFIRLVKGQSKTKEKKIKVKRCQCCLRTAKIH